MTKDGGPAFPGYRDDDGGLRSTPQGGMSLRDYFAAQALVGQLALNAGRNLAAAQLDPERLAVASYGAADAMLKERIK